MLTDGLECCDCFYQTLILTAPIHWCWDTFLHTWWRNKLNCLTFSFLGELILYSNSALKMSVMWYFFVLCNHARFLKGINISPNRALGCFPEGEITDITGQINIHSIVIIHWKKRIPVWLHHETLAYSRPLVGLNANSFFGGAFGAVSTVTLYTK